MSQNTVYLITGANRGIGLGLTTSLLLRPHTTVIATVRSASTPTASLTSLPTAPTSTLLIRTLPSTSDTAAAALVASLPAQHGIAHLDAVIANAGAGASFQPAASTSLQALRDDFEVNALGPVKLFQAALPLLRGEGEGKGGGEGRGKGKFVVVSSALGSLGAVDKSPCLAYGASKAAANYLVRKVHVEHAEIAAVAVHPGWVKTGMGQGFADAVGVEEPPMGLEDCVRGVLAQIDDAERLSGSFVSYDGTIIPW